MPGKNVGPDLFSKKFISKKTHKRAHWHWNAHLIPCHEERTFTANYKSPFPPTPKFILGITQIITRTHKGTMFNQKY